MHASTAASSCDVHGPQPRSARPENAVICVSPGVPADGQEVPGNHFAGTCHAHCGPIRLECSSKPELKHWPSVPCEGFALARFLALLAPAAAMSAVPRQIRSHNAGFMQASEAALATARRLQQDGCSAFVCGNAAAGPKVGVRVFHCKCVPALDCIALKRQLECLLTTGPR
jgi:hypothetical protein